MRASRRTVRLDMTVTNGVVELRGLVESDEERLAMRIALRTSLA